ncbi:SpoIIE family protein phosphatase [Streptomyces sp. NPDC057565]|uniref:SpoIIE family protein phosphatase n=1 Tax=Streptomyces sp. NPDC057565 TaxID=3346169 RepID=UPI0036921657
MASEIGTGVGPLPRAEPVGTTQDADRRCSEAARSTSTTLERGLAFTDTAFAAVYLLDAEGELRSAAEVSMSGTRYGLAEHYTQADRSPVFDVFVTGCPKWFGPGQPVLWAEGDPERQSADVSLGVLPLGSDGRWLGCLVVVDERGSGFDRVRCGLLELYARQLAARLEEADARETGTAAGSEGQGPLLDSSLDHLRVGSFVLETDTGRVDADRRTLDLLGSALEDFDGEVEALLARVVPDDLPALMYVVEPGWASSRDRELEFRVRQSTGEVCWLRLRCRVLADAAGRPERVLGLVAEASCLRSGTDRVSVARRLSAELGDAVTVLDVGRAVAAVLHDPLGADRVALVESGAGWPAAALFDPPDSEAWPKSWSSGSRPQQPAVPTGALSVLEAALREDRMRLWPAGAAPGPDLGDMGPGGLAVVPLSAAGERVGFCLAGWDGPHEFGMAERFLLTVIAGLAGQALVGARAREAEHERAVTFQRSLLPHRLPTLSGAAVAARYLPAAAGPWPGGDWYDVLPLPDSRAALVIGDVQGHDAEAAALMGRIRTAIRAYAMEGHPPDVVVSHANRLLVGTESDLLATCCYVLLDLEEGSAWIVRAGHVPPLLREPEGTVREVEVEGGPPLGVLADAEFPMTPVGLVPGAVLVLLTDGLVGHTDTLREDGVHRVWTELSAVDPSDAGQAADRLLGDRVDSRDDAALLLLRYDGTKVKPARAGSTVWRLPDAVMHARRFTARTLRSWNVTQETDTALLVVSELITNALVHTQGEVRFDLTLTADSLRVAVSDSSPRTPAKPAIADWEATGGRGILLVEAMSAAWGSVPVGGGKQVWSEITLPPREPVPGQAGPGRPGSRSAEEARTG